MVVAQVHVRLLLVLGAVCVLFLLRKPLQYPDKPGSKGFVLVVLAMACWLGSEGLTYFVPNRTLTLALYNVLLFSITVCFVGWFLMAYEFKTQRLPGRPVLLVLTAVALLHLVGLWTNFAWLHELLYRRTLTIENAIVVPDRGPAYWFHPLGVYALIAASTALFVVEGATSSGLRRRQAAVLAISPLPGLAANVAWFAEVRDFPFDLTPVGVAVGGVFLTWALYRTDFLEVAPIARDMVVEEMPEAVVALDEQDRVVDWNPAARGLFGVDAPAVGMPADAFFEMVPSDVLSTFSVTDRTEKQVGFELDGGNRYLSVSISPIDAGQVETLGRVVVVRDITPTKRRERQLLDQNEHLDEFASVVSHDIQGPLMEIRGSASMAERSGDVSHVRPVVDAVDRIERLVDDLLDLARSGQRIEDPGPVDLEAVSAAAWRRVWSVDADIVLAVDETIRADADRLQQLLENLFRNAVEHGPTRSQNPRDDHGTRDGTGNPTSSGDSDSRSIAGTPTQSGDSAPRDSPSAPRTNDDADDQEPPRAQTALDEPGGAEREDRTSSGDVDDGNTTVRVTVGSLPDGFYVEDDGRGIPTEERADVFERGYTSSDDGLGIGLGIVRQIVDAHGWRIRVTAGDAGGARFEITGVEALS
jgi:PAS domain S-box-containing protein